MKRTTIKTVWFVLVIALLTVARVHAQSEAGTVAAVVGTLEIQRGGAWQPSPIGVPVFVGDRLRTGAGDRAKIVFRDDSVLDIGADSEVVLDKQIFDPSVHQVQSVLRLVKGKIRAWVSDYYHEPRARYEVETPTAVAGVRGTEFIAMYSKNGEYTDIVGISEQVEVRGKLAVMGSVVAVNPQFLTHVEKGRFPTTPQRLDDARFRQYNDGLDIVGTGRRDGLSVQHPAVAGHLVSPQDVPAGVSPVTEAATTAAAAAGGLMVGPPQPFLAQQLSQDVYTNTQPLLDFQQAPPGVPPTGGVRVGF
jgi:FecR-like protein